MEYVSCDSVVRLKHTLKDLIISDIGSQQQQQEQKQIIESATGNSSYEI